MFTTLKISPSNNSSDAEGITVLILVLPIPPRSVKEVAVVDGCGAQYISLFDYKRGKLAALDSFPELELRGPN